MRYSISYIHPVYGKQSIHLSLSNSFYLTHSAQRNWRCVFNNTTPYGSHICNYVYCDDKNNEEFRFLIEFGYEPSLLSCSLYGFELDEGTNTYRKYYYSDLHVHICQLK